MFKIERVITMRTSVRRCEQDAYTGALMHDAPLVCDYELGFCLLIWFLFIAFAAACEWENDLAPPTEFHK
jgi:hypothetical protein